MLIRRLKNINYSEPRPEQSLVDEERLLAALKNAVINSMFRGRRMDLYICKFKQTHAYIDVQVRMSNYQVVAEREGG